MAAPTAPTGGNAENAVFRVSALGSAIVQQWTIGRGIAHPGRVGNDPNPHPSNLRTGSHPGENTEEMGPRPLAGLRE